MQVVQYAEYLRGIAKEPSTLGELLPAKLRPKVKPPL
jgi:hypothetical protein